MRNIDLKITADQITHLGHGVHAHTGAVDLHLVCVHGSVGHQNLGVLDALGLQITEFDTENSVCATPAVPKNT